IQVRPGGGRERRGSQAVLSPKVLLEPSRRQVIWVLSDCRSRLWQQGAIYEQLEAWGQVVPVSLVQLLPERLWSQTCLAMGEPVRLRALLPGVPNQQLRCEALLPAFEVEEPEGMQASRSLRLPVVTLEPEPVYRWSRMVAGVGNAAVVGIRVDLAAIARGAQVVLLRSRDAEFLVRQFRVTASLLAQRLAGLMAAVPVSLPVINLIQQTLLPESLQVHVAEVFMSGLLERESAVEQPAGEPGLGYEFVPGVRDVLLAGMPTNQTEAVLDAVSADISERLGLSTRSFAALMAQLPELVQRFSAGDAPRSAADELGQQLLLPFARIAIQTLERLGGYYAEVAQQLAQPVGALRRNDEVEPAVEPEAIQLQPFTFRTATLQKQPSGSSQRENGWEIQAQEAEAQRFIEILPGSVELAMVLIPGGTFDMGSRDDKGRSDDEGPQHPVTVPQFFLGQYAVTQAQYEAVMGSNPATRYNEERFVSPNRPVVGVSWHDAIAFCQRLSKQTGKDYRLPSEAEWEYACRAGTTTPFHFGETISSEVANYVDNTYGEGTTGRYRERLIDVGSLGYANAFGLYDMHGNVWEWCVDHWHNDYRGAPDDGSAWLTNDDNARRLLRGGSWNDFPRLCRSAYRTNGLPATPAYHVGFRVACSAARTL
ncbi:SAV_2336 N-terminal domain-related protein, partial [Trichothermofontia sp.]